MGLIISRGSSIWRLWKYFRPCKTVWNLKDSPKSVTPIPSVQLRNNYSKRFVCRRKKTIAHKKIFSYQIDIPGTGNSGLHKGNPILVLLKPDVTRIFEPDGSISHGETQLCLLDSTSSISPAKRATDSRY